MQRRPINTGTIQNDGTGDTLRSAFEKTDLNFIDLYGATSNSDNLLNAVAITANAAFNRANLSNDIASIVAFSTTANLAYSQANSAYNLANSGSGTSQSYNTANAAFAAANQAHTLAEAAFGFANNITVPNVVPAFTTANHAYSTANAAFNYANTIIGENTNLVSTLTSVNAAFSVANAAFNAANNVVTDFSPAFNKANDAYDLANGAYNYANTLISENTDLSGVYGVANAAFDAANNITIPSMNINSLTDVTIDYGSITAGYVLKWDGSKWAAGVDATSGGGGADADTLEGQHGDYYLNYNNFSNTPNLLIYETKTNSANSFVSANAYAGEMANAANAYAASLTPDLSPAFNQANAAYYIANLAFDKANSDPDAIIWDTANAAFNKANTANLLAYNTGISANAYAGQMANASNNWANSLVTGASQISTGNLNVTYTVTAGKFIKLGGTEEAFTTNTNSVTGVQAFDCSNAYTFYLTNVTGSFTPNLVNFTCDTNNVTSVAFVINQGASANVVGANVLIGSANLAINWQGGITPTGSPSKKDVVSLSIFNVNGTYSVLGQVVTFG